MPACNASISGFSDEPYYHLIVAQVIIEANAAATVPVPREKAHLVFGLDSSSKLE